MAVAVPVVLSVLRVAPAAQGKNGAVLEPVVAVVAVVVYTTM
jgi:hypothetical protein